MEGISDRAVNLPTCFFKPPRSQRDRHPIPANSLHNFRPVPSAFLVSTPCRCPGRRPLCPRQTIRRSLHWRSARTTRLIRLWLALRYRQAQIRAPSTSIQPLELPSLRKRAPTLSSSSVSAVDL